MLEQKRLMETQQEILKFLTTDIVKTVSDACKSSIEAAGIAAGSVTQDFLQSTLTAQLAPIKAALATASTPSTVQKEPTPEPAPLGVSSLQTFKHPDGSFKSVPVDFKLPGRGNPVKISYALWLKGNPARGIRPYRDLTHDDFGVFKQSPTGRKLEHTNRNRRFSEWKKVFDFLLSKLSTEDQVQLDDPTDDLVDSTWESIEHHLYDNVAYAEETSAGDLYRKKVGSQCVSTAYGYITRKHGSATAPGEGFVHRRKRGKKAQQQNDIDDDMDEDA